MTPQVAGRGCWLWRTRHERVIADEVVEHAFSHGCRADHTERLAAYWAEALGGPAMWSDQGEDETSVVRLHSGNGIHTEMADRSIACFDQAVIDAGLDQNPQLEQTLRDYWRWALTNMNAQPDTPDTVPTGLAVPKWSWDGPV